MYQSEQATLKSIPTLSVMAQKLGAEAASASSSTHYETPANLQRETHTKSIADQQDDQSQQLKRLTNLFQALPGAVVMLDGAGQVSQANPAARDLLGEPLIAQAWGEVVSRAFAPRWDDGHDISLVNGRVVNIATQPMIDEPGQILLIKDVTETRHLQTQLTQAKRLSAKGEMAAALAHQIRTPLASAMLYLSNLQTHQLDEAARKKFTGKALQRLKHLERVIEDMLLFARGGQFTLKPESVDTLIEELEQQVHPMLTESGAQFTTQIQHAVSIPANRAALISILQNLIDNALQACKRKANHADENYVPSISLKVSQLSPQMVQISLEDNGPGITDAVKERLFEPFVTSRANGTGLGLAVVQAVVRSHQGAIRLAKSDETGSRFEINLPVISPDTDKEQ